jgi:hypothetical protein
MRTDFRLQGITSDLAGRRIDTIQFTDLPVDVCPRSDEHN